MNSPDSGFLIFCEFVRPESDGKLSIFGTHGPAVDLLGAAEGAINLALWGRFEFPPIKTLPRSAMSVVLKRGDESISLLSGDAERAEQPVQRPEHDADLPLVANMAFQFNLVHVKEGDVIVAAARFGDFVTERTLMIRRHAVAEAAGPRKAVANEKATGEVARKGKPSAKPRAAKKKVT